MNTVNTHHHHHVLVTVLLLAAALAQTPSAGRVFHSLADLPLTQSGDTVQLPAGVFTNNCSLILSTANLTIRGAGAGQTVLRCPPGQRVLEATSAASGLRMMDLSLEHTSAVAAAAETAPAPSKSTLSSGGLLFLQTGRATLQGLRLAHGRAQGCGGALLVQVGATADLQLQLLDLDLSDNSVASSSRGGARGGAVAVTLLAYDPHAESGNAATTSTASARSVLVRGCRFAGNSAVASGAASNAIGGGLLVAVEGGAAAVEVQLDNCTFVGNTALGTTPGGQLTACGAACVLNMNVTDPTQGPIASVSALRVTNSTFISNVANCLDCQGGAASPNASNTGALGVLVVNTFEVADSLFVNNTARCGGQCLAEGGAIFAQGPGGTPAPGARPFAMRMVNCRFVGNNALCSGAGCTTQGGGLVGVVISPITLINTTLTANRALALGSDTTALGGALQFQDGFPSGGGTKAAGLPQLITIEGGELTDNQAEVVGAGGSGGGGGGGGLTLGALGGGINILSFLYPTTMLVESCVWANNSAQAKQSTAPRAFGGAVGAVTVGPNAAVVLNLRHSLVTGGRVVETPAGGAAQPRYGAAVGMFCAAASCPPGTAIVLDKTIALDVGSPLAGRGQGGALLVRNMVGEQAGGVVLANGSAVRFTCAYLETLALAAGANASSSVEQAAAINASCAVPTPTPAPTRSSSSDTQRLALGLGLGLGLVIAAALVLAVVAKMRKPDLVEVGEDSAGRRGRGRRWGRGAVELDEPLLTTAVDL